MKKHILVLMFALVGISSVNAASKNTVPVDSVDFWKKTEALWKKQGKGSEKFADYAQNRLHRVQTRRAHKGKLSSAATTAGLASWWGGKKSSSNVAKSPLSQRESEAFAKGKKSGEDHERRLLKKKSSTKKSAAARARTEEMKKRMAKARAARNAKLAKARAARVKQA